MESTVQKKICLVGDFSVGKTSLIRRFVERQFSDEYLTTIGVKISRKLVETKTKDGDTIQQIKLVIWDLEGQTKYKKIKSSYLQGASGAIIVADATRPETLSHLQEHLELFDSANPQGFSIVALNKADLLTEEQLDIMRQKYQFEQQKQVLATYLTSAKTGDNVDQMFHQLAKSLI